MRKLAFLLYDNRSGSTLLSALLSERAGVAVSHETDLVPAVLEVPARRGVLGVSELVAYLYTETRFAELALDRETVAAALRRQGETLSREAALHALVRHYFETHAPEAEAWVVKGPRLHYHLDALATVFPEATMLHLVRDGRAVFRSKRTTPSGYALRTGEQDVMDADLVRAACNWQRKIDLVDAFDGLPVATTRYEDVLTDAEAALAGILETLGVSESGRERSGTRAAFVEHQIGHSYHDLHTNVAGDLNPAKAVQWQRDLRPAEIEAYEALAGGALDRYGYERLAEAESGVWQQARLLGLRLRREGRRWAALGRAMRRGDAVRLLRGKAFEWKARRSA
ncbi:MAG: sulfotransferase [Rhodothermaceae bacterium]|nr:sulfotransferase [Rhodothermaceae bacterium]